MRLDLDAAPLMLGFIHRPTLKENFRCATVLSRSNCSFFVNRRIIGTLISL